jgi:hypothetical protein
MTQSVPFAYSALMAADLKTLSPFFGFIGDKFAELTRRHWHWKGTELRKSLPYLGRRESRI